MKSNYIIAHCVYTLLKSVDAITVLVIHHSTKIIIAVNFTFFFFLIYPEEHRFQLACFGSNETLEGSQHTTAPITVGNMWRGDYHAHTLIPSGEICPSWGLPMLSWDGFKTSWDQLPLKVALISADSRPLDTNILRCLKPDQLKCFHPSGVVVCRRRIDGP